MSAPYVCRRLVCGSDAAEEQRVAVAFGGRAGLSHAFQQLPHGGKLPLPDEPLPRPDVHRRGVQLEVLEG